MAAIQNGYGPPQSDYFNYWSSCDSTEVTSSPSSIGLAATEYHTLSNLDPCQSSCTKYELHFGSDTQGSSESFCGGPAVYNNAIIPASLSDPTTAIADRVIPKNYSAISTVASCDPSTFTMHSRNISPLPYLSPLSSSEESLLQTQCAVGTPPNYRQHAASYDQHNGDSMYAYTAQSLTSLETTTRLWRRDSWGQPEITPATYQNCQHMVNMQSTINPTTISSTCKSNPITATAQSTSTSPWYDNSTSYEAHLIDRCALNDSGYLPNFPSTSFIQSVPDYPISSSYIPNQQLICSSVDSSHLYHNSQCSNPTPIASFYDYNNNFNSWNQPHFQMMNCIERQATHTDLYPNNHFDQFTFDQNHCKTDDQTSLTLPNTNLCDVKMERQNLVCFSENTKSSDKKSFSFKNDVNEKRIFSSSNNGTIQLWQFLLEELMSPSSEDYICWTGNGWEFQIKNPEEVARRWGKKKKKPKMNYEKLSRSLRYYYDKKIIKKTHGKRYVYRYVRRDMNALLNSSSSITSFKQCLPTTKQVIC